ncbi:hypothetical protein V8B97DRAFT_1920241 [Scleroderma yunnanense]
MTIVVLDNGEGVKYIITFMTTIAMLTTFNANNPIVAANVKNLDHSHPRSQPWAIFKACRMFSKSKRNLLKCKVDDDNVQHLASPRKKMALTVSYTGLSDTDLLTTVFEEDFRMKCIHFDLGTPCPVCKVLQELVGPHYLKLIGLEASESGWIRVNDNNCNGLLLWKCLKTFVSPKFHPWPSKAPCLPQLSPREHLGIRMPVFILPWSPPSARSLVCNLKSISAYEHFEQTIFSGDCIIPFI